MCCSALSFTSTIDEDGWSMKRPGPFNQGKGMRYPNCRSLGEKQVPAWTFAENLAPLGFDLRTVQSIASGYTN